MAIKHRIKFKDTIKKVLEKKPKYDLVELPYIDCSEDPVRPELDLAFRQAYGRKIYGLKDEEGDVCAIMCFGFTNEIPKTIEEFDLMTKDAHLQSASWRNDNVGKIAIAYTVWSKKKGGGKLIVKEAFKKIKKSNHLNRLVTLSPLILVTILFIKSISTNKFFYLLLFLR